MIPPAVNGKGTGILCRVIMCRFGHLRRRKGRPHPRPLSPKGARGEFIQEHYPFPLGGKDGPALRDRVRASRSDLVVVNKQVEQGAGRREGLVRRFASRPLVCWAGLILFSLAAPLLARDIPPGVPPPKPTVISAPAIQALPNGLQVVVVERHTLPLITLRLVVKAGAEFDPAQLPGTAALVNSLLTEGTARRTARQIAEAIDSVGGLVDNGVGWDSSFLSLSVLSDQADLAFDLVSDMIEHPAFQPAEIERQRRQTLSGLKVAHDDPAYVADTLFQKLVFEGTPYSHPEDGTLESVAHITAGDLRSFQTRYYQPANCILAVVGDITVPEAFARAARFFSAWENLAPPAPPPPPAPAPPDVRRVLAIDKPDAVQTEIRIGNLGAPRNSPDYLALSVANEILGGPSENRLFKALRSRQGLTYGASSELVCRRSLGAWVAKTFTRTPETLKSAHITLEQMELLRDHEISRPELETAQSYLVGHLALEFESSEDVASQVLELIQNGLPLDYWNRYPEKIQALTADDIWNATKRYLDTEHNVIVLVGNVSDFKKDLKKLGPAQVMPLSEMDFGSPDLVRSQGKAGK
jgi:zinc protease